MPNRRKVLSYYDGIAGTKFKQEMREKRVQLSNVIRAGLAKFNLSIEEEPAVLRAKVLREVRFFRL